MKWLVSPLPTQNRSSTKRDCFKLVKAPLPKIPSFLVAANIFSFLGYSDKVLLLLSVISRNTALYARKHRSNLGQYLVKFSPKVFFTEPLNFVNKFVPSFADHVKAIEEVEQIPQNLYSYKPYKLQSITLRIKNNALVAG